MLRIVSSILALFFAMSCCSRHDPEDFLNDEDIALELIGPYAGNTVNTLAHLDVSPLNAKPSVMGTDSSCTEGGRLDKGYTRPKEYVVTEWPVKENVVPDFWSLVYDHDCPAIVVLCTPERSPDENFNYGEDDDVDDVPVQGLAFFRTNRMGKLFWCRPYSIVSLTELMAGVKAEPKTCQLFQLTCWPEGHKVPLSTNSLVELMNMVERWRAKTDYGPVVVVS
ncbi:unnamed protein product, partial [Notodromas monacha]